MSLKILPIRTYPFINTQNQFYEIKEGKIELADLFDLEHNAYGSILFNSDFGNQNDYFNHADTPSVNTLIGLGEMELIIDLSVYSFNEKYMELFEIVGNEPYNIQDIKFLVIRDEDKQFDITKDYYYFVERVQRLNNLTYRFSLSYDLVKSYFKEIMRFQNIKPNRYFPKVNDYFNFDNNIVQNRNFIDPLLPISTTDNVRERLCHVFKNKNPDDIYETYYTFTGLWEYYYMAFSGDDGKDTFRFKDQDYYILAFPKTYADYDNSLVYNRNIKSILDKSPFLLKIVTSDIPPFNNNFVYNENTKFTIDYNAKGIKSNYETINNYGVTPNVTGATEPYTLYNESDYIRMIDTHYLDSNDNKYKVNSWHIPKSLSDLLETTVNNDSHMYLYCGTLMIIKNDNPNNSTLNNLLRPLGDLSNRVAITYFTRNNYIDIINVKSDLQSEGEQDDQIDLLKLFENVSIGYELNNKMNISFNKMKIEGSQLKMTFSSYIEHSLEKTTEKIKIANVNTSGESFATREEINSTKITDDYFNYVHLNKNAIEQKTKQYELNNYLNIAKTGISIASAFATGGLSTMVSIGLGFNSVSSIVNNEMSKQSFQASLEDKRLSPLKYEGGNINTNGNIDLYLPYLIVGRNISTYDNNYMSNDNKQYNLKIIELLKDYGYYTPLEKLNTFEECFNRINYNFIELRDADKVKLYFKDKIRNNHFRSILEILANGIRFYNIDGYTNGELNNGERSI